MSTTADRLGGDTWLQVPATWGAYLRLLRARGDRASPRYIYRDGSLTIVSPGLSHESIKLRLAWLIETMFVELGIPFLGSGSVTLKQGRPKRKGVEGDTSYYVRNLDRLRGRRTLDMAIDPPPDLEVEVVVSHPVREPLGVHAAFGVPEVWVYEASGITFLRLGADGEYQISPTSRCVPILASDEFSAWVGPDDSVDEVAHRRAFRRWVIEALAPRLRADEQRPEEPPPPAEED